MVKRALTLLTSLLIALPLLMPFNIYGDTIDLTNIIGVNTELIDSTFIETVSINNNPYQRMAFNYESTIELDANYVGYINVGFKANYYLQLSSGLSTGSVSYPNKKLFVNGDKVKFSWSIVSTYTGTDPFIRSSYVNNPNITIVESGLTKIEELNSLEQIINILSELYNSNDQVEGLLNNQYTQLQLVVSNTSLANQYLETLTKMKQWNIPLESYSYVYSLLKYNYQIYDFNQYNYLNYPIFNIQQGQYILNYPTGINYSPFIWIFGADPIFNSSNYVNYFEFQEGITINSFEQIIGGSNIRIWKIDLTNRSGSPDIQITSKVNNFKLLPIYFYNKSNKCISTEFALRYGLSNKLLDDINIIANGTVQSSSAASSNDLANEQLQNESNTLFQQENGFKSDMQSAMQNVNNTFRLQDMGTKFVSSAQWVRTQYERLTNNTPFASLITFSLITGLALILLGKVYK